MKIIAIGRNYVQHAKELNNPVPDEPVVFLMPDTCILNNNKPFFYPDFSNNIHHEIEIVLKISKVGRNIDLRFAHRYFEEITVGVDFTARDLQKIAKEKGLPWEKAKAFDGAAPVGKFVRLDKCTDPKAVDFSLDINDQRIQTGNTSHMLFSFDEIISHVSKYFTLQMGDLIFTGTPAGVGPVTVGDRLVGKIGDEVLLDFVVK
ncbi:MAG: fumarylacetoacetate hydrolase family protein [Bacteroidales bacterium]|nr:fumarylacetoacetate hydrolase family protein [Bacteroidales bacterium]